MNPTRIFLVALVFTSISAKAELPVPQFLNYPAVVSRDVVAPIDVELFDIDEDGDLDVIYADTDSSRKDIAWIENEGGGRFGTRHILTTLLNNPTDFAFADLNGDLQMDIVEVSSFGPLGPEVAWQQGQGNGQFVGKQTLFLGLHHLNSVDTGDMDGDLDIDIVMATGFGPVWLENQSMSFLTVHPITDFSHSNQAQWEVQVADLDGDGDLDVVSREQRRKLIYVSINSGGGTFAAPVSINTAPREPAQFDLTDLDGDGDLDLVIGLEYSDDRRISWFPNNGNGAFGNEVILARSQTNRVFGYVRGALGSDIDRDGDLDVVALTGEEVFWMENLGQGNFGPRQMSFVDGNGFFRLATGDIDGDRDEDVLTVDWGREMILWLRNTENPPLIFDFSLSSGAIPSGGQAELRWNVPDADTVSISPVIGNVPTVSTTNVAPAATTTYTLTATHGAEFITKEVTLLVDEAPRIESFEASDSSVVAGDQVELSWTVLGAESLSISGIGPVVGQNTSVTVNGTTTYTLTATNAHGSQTAMVTVNVGGPPVIHSFTATPGNVSRNDPVMLSWNVTGADHREIDFDLGTVGNGPLEIPASGPRTYTLTATNEYGASTAQASVSMADEALFDTPVLINWTIEEPGRQACGDFDGDGDNDIAVSYLDDDLVGWHENDGNGSFGAMQTISSVEGRALGLVAADLDGDNDIDLASASLDDGLVWFENNGAGLFGPRQIVDAAPGARTVKAIDFDGDGDLDLVAAVNKELQWHENVDGMGTFGPERFIDANDEYTPRIACGDFDGDGDPDIVTCVDFGPTMQWYENRGDGVIIQIHVIADDIDRFRNIRVADLDLDGDLDLVTNHFSDGIFKFLNDGSGVFAPRVLISSAVSSVDTIEVADLTNDGNPEVLIGGREELAWLDNRGNATFGSKQTIVDGGVADYDYLETCDLNGDDSPDLIFSAVDDDRIYFALNLSEARDLPPVFPNPPPNITTNLPVGGSTAVVNWTAPVAIDDHTPNPVVELVSARAPGSAFPIGSEMVTYRATDGSGNTNEVSFTVTVVDVFGNWETTHGLSNTLSNPTRDTEFDRIYDFLEFAYHLNPKVAERPETKTDQPGVPKVFIEEVNGRQHLAMRYTRRIEDLGLIYAVDSSTDLLTWLESDPDVEVVSVSPSGDGVTEIVHVRYTTPLGDVVDERLFLRLRVTADGAD